MLSGRTGEVARTTRQHVTIYSSSERSGSQLRPSLHENIWILIHTAQEFQGRYHVRKCAAQALRCRTLLYFRTVGFRTCILFVLASWRLPQFLLEVSSSANNKTEARHDEPSTIIALTVHAIEGSANKKDFHVA